MKPWINGISKNISHHQHYYSCVDSTIIVQFSWRSTCTSYDSHMMRAAKTSSALLLIALQQALVKCQFFSPPNASRFTKVEGPLGIKIRYQQVETGPHGICEQNSSVTSYSGFVDVSEHEHYFFWLFSARDVDPKDAPLTAWISGGPGASSMSELFTEHGPCSIDQYYNVNANPYAWNALSNTVYIDQPTTVGFSYTDPISAQINQDSCDIVELSNSTCPSNPSGEQNCDNYGITGPCGTFPSPNPRYTANSTESAAVPFWSALQGVFAAFPQYSQHGFTLGSESYGGHYAPVFSRHIAHQNANLPNGAIQIPQTAVVVNNGWFDPAVAYTAAYSFLVDPGNTYDVTISKKHGSKMKHALYGRGKCLDGLAKCNSPNGTDSICGSVDNFCTSNMQSAYYVRDEYDVREIDPDPFPPSYYVNYLNTMPVLRKLAVFTNYTDQSQITNDLFLDTGDDAKELGITQALVNLLDAGVGITLMHGDADYDCNWYGGQVMVAKIAKGSTTPGLKDAYAEAGYQNLTTSDGIVHGQVKQAGLLSFVRVYEAGHQVGFFQPLAEKAIHDRSVAGMDIATGKINVKGPGTLYQSTGPAESTYREGRRTVQDAVLPGNATYNHTTNEPNLKAEDIGSIIMSGTQVESNAGSRAAPWNVAALVFMIVAVACA